MARKGKPQPSKFNLHLCVPGVFSETQHFPNATPELADQLRQAMHNALETQHCKVPRRKPTERKRDDEMLRLHEKEGWTYRDLMEEFVMEYPAVKQALRRTRLRRQQSGQ
jgi:hypothetical protein